MSCSRLLFKNVRLGVVGPDKLTWWKFLFQRRRLRRDFEDTLRWRIVCLRKDHVDVIAKPWFFLMPAMISSMWSNLVGNSYFYCKKNTIIGDGECEMYIAPIVVKPQLFLAKVFQTVSFFFRNVLFSSRNFNLIAESSKVDKYLKT